MILLVVLAALGLAAPADAASLTPTRVTTKNGLTVLLLSRHALPTVHLHVLVKAGSVHDPEDKAGLAFLAADLLDEGTATRTATQIAEAIEFVGATLTTRARRDFSTISLRILKKDTLLGMELVAEILQHPSFPQEEVARTRHELISSLLAEEDEPGLVADKAFRELVFGGHPYHRPVKGYQDTVQRITRDDIVQFHRTYYRPNNTILAIVGDLTKEEVRILLKKFFNGWEKGRVPKTKPPQPARLKGKTVRLLDRDLTQANIVLGHLGLPRTHRDYYAVTVMNYILGGGGFASRLLTTIRDDQGLAYSAYSRFDSSQYPGAFGIRLQTKNESASEAIEAVLAEINKMRSGAIRGQEVKEAKAFLTDSFPIRIDTNAKVAPLLGKMEFYRLGLDYMKRYPRLIKAVRKKDVQRVARKYLDPENFALVVVANQGEAGLHKKF